MHSFYDFFKPCGFDPKTLMPSYGLAEFTLCATSQPSGRPLNILWVDQQVRSSPGLPGTGGWGYSTNLPLPGHHNSHESL